MKFEELLKKQKNQNTVELVDKAKQESEQTGYTPDDRFWRPELDKAGNAFAVIRFLPAPDTDIPWAKYYTHGFKGPTGQWYIEDCPTSIGEKCPACENNNQLWQTGLETDKDIVRKRKRRLHYVSNILILKDKATPENEGKVFLYKYGSKIFDKIMNAMEPPFEDEDPINPFNLFSGANFKLKVKQVEGTSSTNSNKVKYWNYDSSEFESQSELFGGNEEKLEKVFKSLYEIGEFTDSNNYKTYSELQLRLNAVLGEESSAAMEKYRSEPSEYEDSFKADSSNDANDDLASKDDDMEAFRKLLNDDDDDISY
jgi:hypothetical protein